MKTTSLVLAVRMGCLTLGGCAAAVARYDEAVAKGEVPICAQSQNLFDPIAL